MNWLPTLHRKQADEARHPWTPEETAILAEAVRQAPSVHNTQPWTLQVHDRTIKMSLTAGPELVQHDPQGRDRRISWGAAVANLGTTLRSLGWGADVHWQLPDDEADGEVTVIGTHRQPVTTIDRERYRAIAQRSSYRRAFSDRPIPHLARTAIAAASVTQATWIHGQEERQALARRLAFAGRANQGDAGYQRELRLWTAAGGGEGLVPGALAESGVPALGLVTAETKLPGEERIAEWLEHESVLVLSTLTDGARDQVRAGMAAERAWLEAVRLGLVASVMTQPLRLPEVRYGLRDDLDLAGIPQVMLRIGYASETPARNGVRRPLPDIFDD